MLQVFDGHLDKIRLQKLLFLMTIRQLKPEYDFVPYKFGCYSFSANADLMTMAAKGWIAEEEEKGFRKLDKTDYCKQLKPADLELLLDIKNSFDKMTPKALMKHTYLNYPFYATKSVVAETLLTPDELAVVNKARIDRDETILFTIGYEGISLEEYLARLIRNDVKLLIDVRNNPMSMKYGFSKSQLKKYCGSLGISYIHIPEVGIQADQRQELNSQKDYDELFTLYRNNNLSKTLDYQQQILDLLIEHKRIALTCFEANICQCHRKHLAEAIEGLPMFKYELRHI